MADMIEKAKYDAAMETVGTLQRKLDAALQKHHDDAAAQKDALAKQGEEHGKKLEAVQKKHKDEMERKDKAHELALAKALSETPEAKVHREEMAAIAKEAQDKAKASVAKFKATVG